MLKKNSKAFENEEFLFEKLECEKCRIVESMKP